MVKKSKKMLSEWAKEIQGPINKQNSKKKMGRGANVMGLRQTKGGKAQDTSKDFVLGLVD